MTGIGNRLIDITGKKFNMLRALVYIGSSEYEFKCDCGSITEMDGTRVRKGLTKSCGCTVDGSSLIQGIEGQKFGNLVVIEYVSQGKWKCQCDCGKTAIAYGRRLVKGITKSCGCLSGVMYDVL